jgi:natural product precursor
MKNVKSLSSFSNSSIKKSELKKIVGGAGCDGNPHTYYTDCKKQNY